MVAGMPGTRSLGCLPGPVMTAYDVAQCAIEAERIQAVVASGAASVVRAGLEQILPASVIDDDRDAEATMTLHRSAAYELGLPAQQSLRVARSRAPLRHQ
jgi:hypothetical protein